MGRVKDRQRGWGVPVVGNIQERIHEVASPSTRGTCTGTATTTTRYPQSPPSRSLIAHQSVNKFSEGHLPAMGERECGEGKGGRDSFCFVFCFWRERRERERRRREKRERG
jgi:hypothetical protein